MTIIPLLLYGCPAMLIPHKLRGWRNTVEVVLFEISNSMKPYPSVVHAYTGKLEPVIGFCLSRRKLEEVSTRIPPTSQLVKYTTLHYDMICYIMSSIDILTCDLTLCVYVYIYIYIYRERDIYIYTCALQRRRSGCACGSPRRFGGCPSWPPNNNNNNNNNNNY